MNYYVCLRCGHITKTRDIDKGVTLYVHECEKCGDFARSTFYSDIIPDREPTQEWYSPSLEVISKKSYDPGMLDHVLNGGWFDMYNDTKVVILQGKSHDFGRAKLEDVRECIENGNVFTNKFLTHSIADDFSFKYKDEIGEITIIK